MAISAPRWWRRRTSASPPAPSNAAGRVATHQCRRRIPATSRTNPDRTIREGRDGRHSEKDVHASFSRAPARFTMSAPPDEGDHAMVLAADYPFLNIFWTMIVFFAWAIWF